MGYDGPIIDAHHHFWDIGLNKHAWLDACDPGDEIAWLRRNQLVEDYLSVSANCDIVATVHVEANWDPLDGLGETEWLERLEKPRGVASRYIAFAALEAPGAEELLDRLAGRNRVAGIREILSWHPDPAKSRVADADRMRNPIWRGNLARLGRHNFSFDLLISPWQLEMARELAEDFPHLRFVLNHCGSPLDRDVEGLKRWRDGLRSLARAPNVAVKLSDPVAYDPRWTRSSLAEIVLHCIDCFGPGRSMFASDYPVSALHIGFEEWVTEFDAIIRDFSEDEKRSMFFGCARDIYRIPV